MSQGGGGMSEREDFTTQFREAVDGMSWEEIARVCRTSSATVTRWYYGKSTPHHIGRPSVFRAIEKFRSTASEESTP